jgi:CheY-like chemotaxis protein/prolyl-tRNA editing enzyme YbaK/EbsC (Cys-tRNA(Pro) deacylase)
MALPRWLKEILNHYGVPFEEHHHPPVYSASQLAQAEHVSGYRVAKTVFVSAAERPVAVVLPSCCRMDLARVQALLGEDARLATEPEIGAWFKGCQPGTVPPLRLRPDMHLLMDRSLAHPGKMIIPAGTPEDAVAVPFRDWYRAVWPGVGCFAVPAKQDGNGRAVPSVLVVEDEAVTNDLLCRLLERQGLACRGVEEGKAALAAAAEMRPSAVLLDLMLPDMSGFDVYERMRRTGPVKRIPVIVVTALDDDESRRRSRQLGADAYLTKPFTAEALVAEVQDALADAHA